MKIAILAPSPVPFALGGAERLWDGLLREINERTPHDAELVKLPTPERSLPDLVGSYHTWSGVNVSHFDLVISGKYPAWMARHDNHVVYMLHTLRGLYDTYPPHLGAFVAGEEPLRLLEASMRRALETSTLAPVFEQFWAAHSALGDDHPAFAFPGPLARQLVHLFDRVALDPSRVRRYLAISATVAARRSYFPPSARVEIARPPSSLEGFRCEGFDYFFTASRLDGPKRVDLLVAAMRHLPADVHLRIAGTGPEADRLRGLARADNRIELLGYVGNDELLDLYAGALAVLFVPRDEDLGFITLEAMAGGKPVVTTSDAGGPTEFVVDGVNGFVTAPSPEAIGRAMTTLAGDRDLARRLGVQAAKTAASVSWESTVATLLRPPSEDTDAPRRRPSSNRRRLVAATTFPVYPRTGGGQLRCCHLFAAMAERWDIELVSLGPADAQETQVMLADGVIETVVPKSPAHQAREEELSREVGVPITDIVASQAIDLTPAYLGALARAADGAAAAVLSHPFMLPALDRVAPSLPFVYEAQDAECHLKAEILPESPAGAALLETVRDVERRTIERARLVSACSEEDAAALVRAYDVDPGKLMTIPNGVEVDRIHFTPLPERHDNRRRWLHAMGELEPRIQAEAVAVFAGSWHMPNIDAAEHIFDLAAEVPEVVFLLIGSHGDYFGRWFPTPSNVVRLGVVSETHKNTLLATADLALNPVIRGSGTNLKIVEYFAAGVPVVSTPFGARGLDVVDGEHLRLAELGDFAQALREVLDDPEPAEERAVRARALVEDKYDWKTLGRRLGDLVADALGGEGDRSPRMVR